MKIACCGTHGAGKSTLSYQLADYYKRKKKSVYVVQEKVRESPFPINVNMSEETALWTFTSQIAHELEVEQQGYDTLICDRSCFDTFIYTDFFRLKNRPINHFRIASEEWLETYDFFFFVRPNMELLEDKIRDNTDKFFQISVDRLFEDFFSHIDNDFFQEVFTSQILKEELDFDDILKNL